MNFPRADRKKPGSEMMRRIFAEPSTEKDIIKWHRDHKHLVTPEWWKQLWADFNDDTEEILEYLESLCRHCLSETVNQKGCRMCLECYSMDC